MTKIYARAYLPSDPMPPNLIPLIKGGTRAEVRTFTTPEGGIVAFGGIIVDDNARAAETWLFPLDGFIKYPLASFAVRDDLRSLENYYMLPRYQMQTFTEKDARFAEWLGYEYEGTMRKSYQGKDARMYARVTEWQ